MIFQSHTSRKSSRSVKETGNNRNVEEEEKEVISKRTTHLSNLQAVKVTKTKHKLPRTRSSTQARQNPNRNQIQLLQ